MNDVFLTFLLGPRNAADAKRSPLDERDESDLQYELSIFTCTDYKTFKHGSGIESSYVDVQSSYRITLNVPKFG